LLFAGALGLVDVSDQLPELKRRPGLTTWEVTRTHTVHAHVRCKLIITSLNVVCQVFDMNKPRKRNKAEEEAEIKWAPGWYSAHDALPSRSKKFIHASCFPPANAKDLHLERWYAYLLILIFVFMLIFIAYLLADVAVLAACVCIRRTRTRADSSSR
jgi:hypothetical protein